MFFPKVARGEICLHDCISWEQQGSTYGSYGCSPPRHSSQPVSTTSASFPFGIPQNLTVTAYINCTFKTKKTFRSHKAKPKPRLIQNTFRCQIIFDEIVVEQPPVFSIFIGFPEFSGQSGHKRTRWIGRIPLFDWEYRVRFSLNLTVSRYKLFNHSFNKRIRMQMFHKMPTDRGQLWTKRQAWPNSGYNRSQVTSFVSSKRCIRELTFLQ
jgi:hypothetical protein